MSKVAPDSYTWTNWPILSGSIQATAVRIGQPMSQDVGCCRDIRQKHSKAMEMAFGAEIGDTPKEASTHA